MRLDFDMGVAMGQALEQIKAHSGRLDDHDSRLEKIEGKVRLAESWLGRVITAGTLWAASLGIHLNAETFGQALYRLLRAIGSAGQV